MDRSNHDHIPADLTEVAERLRAERPTVTPIELDRIKLRARRQAERSWAGIHIPKKGALMKSRLALMLMIVAGLMMSSTGATLAITGSSGSGSAAQNQYDQVQPDRQDQSQPEGQQLGDVEAGDDGEAAPAADQVAVAGDGDEALPFTGFLAIPLLIGGVMLISFGAIMRRKAD